MADQNYIIGVDLDISKLISKAKSASDELDRIFQNQQRQALDAVRRSGNLEPGNPYATPTGQFSQKAFKEQYQNSRSALLAANSQLKAAGLSKSDERALDGLVRKLDVSFNRVLKEMAKVVGAGDAGRGVTANTVKNLGAVINRGDQGTDAARAAGRRAATDYIRSASAPGTVLPENMIGANLAPLNAIPVSQRARVRGDQELRDKARQLSAGFDTFGSEVLENLGSDLVGQVGTALNRAVLLPEEAQVSGALRGMARQREGAIEAEKARFLDVDDRRGSIAADQAVADVFERRVQAQTAAIRESILAEDGTYLGGRATAEFSRRRQTSFLEGETSELLNSDAGKDILSDEVRATVNKRLFENRKALQVEEQIARALPDELAAIGRTAQLKRLRETQERLAARKASGPGLNQQLAGDALLDFGRQSDDALKKNLVNQLRGGSDDQAVQLRNNERAIRRQSLLDQTRERAQRSEFFAGDADDSQEARANQERAIRQEIVDQLRLKAVKTRAQLDLEEGNRELLSREYADRVRANALRRTREAGDSQNLAAEIITAERAELEAKQKKARLARESVSKEQLLNDATEDAAQAAAREEATLRRRLIVARQALGLQDHRAQLELKGVRLVAATNEAENARRLAITRETALRRAGFNRELRSVGLPDVQAPGGGGGGGRTGGGRLGAGSDPERGPSRFQRAFSRFQGFDDPLQAPRFGNFIAQRALTTASFAASGALLFGGVQAIRELINEAEELERLFNQIEAQLESTDRGHQFEAVRRSIFETARATGSAADEVANVQFQFQGAFGGNTVKAIDETREAFESVKVTGLEIREVIDAFTSLTQNEFKLPTFTDASGETKQLEVNIESVTDKALGLQERFGVLAKETISFAADLAPVAASLGFTVGELESLGAVAQKYSGRSGTSLAEAFGRIFPQIQESDLQFTQLFRSAGLDADSLASSFADGNIADVFKQIIAGYQELSSTNRGRVVDLLGGRREAAAIIPILENSTELLEEFGNVAVDVGKQDEYLAKQQETLSFKMSQAAEAFRQLGVAAFEAGIGDFLKDIAELAVSAADGLHTVGAAVGNIGLAISNLPGAEHLDKLVQVGLAFAGVKAAQSFAKFAGVGQGVGVAGAISSRFAGIGTRVAAGRAVAGPTIATARQFAAGGALSSAGLAKVTAGATASGIKTAFAGTASTFFGVGATVGLLAYESLLSGVKSERDKYRAELDAIFGDSIRDEDQTTLLRRARSNTGLDLSTFEDFSSIAVGSRSSANAKTRFNGQTLDEVSLKRAEKELGIAAASDAGTKEHLLDRIGLSKAKEKARAEIAELFDNLAGQGDEAATLILEAADENQEAFRELVLASQTDEERVRLESPQGAKELEELIASEKIRYQDLQIAIRERTATTEQVLEVIQVAFEQQGYGGLGEALATTQRIKEAERASLEQSLSLIQGLPTLQSAFDAGDIGMGEFLNGLRAVEAELDRLGYNGPGATEDQKATADAARRARENVLGSFDVNRANFRIDNFELSNGDGAAAAQFEYDELVSILEGGNLTQEQEREVAERAIEAKKKVFAASIEGIESAEETARLMAQGFTFDKAIAAERLEQYLTLADQGFQEFADEAVGFTSLSMAEFTDAIAELVASTQVSVADATVTVLKEQLEKLKATLGRSVNENVRSGPAAADFAIGEIDFLSTDEIDAINNSILGIEGKLDEAKGLADAPDFSRGTSGDAKEAQKKAVEDAAEKAKSAALANLDRAAALADGDPVKLADIAIRKAEIERRYAQQAGDEAGVIQAEAAGISARQEARNAQRAIADAQLDLDLANKGDGAVAGARSGLEAANRAIERASGVQAEIEAQAAKVRAERGLRDAIFGVFESQIGLLSAVADYAGDPTEVARLQIGLIQAQIARLPESDLVGEDLTIARNNLDAQLITAKGRLRDTQLSEDRELLSFQLEIGQISRGQAIAALQAMLAIPELTEKQVRDITLEIKRMRDALGSDYQFNLPTQLGLPTVYEVSRLNQGVQSGMGSGYNDNRQIQVNVYAETNASPAEIGAAVAAVVGDPSRSGTTARRY